MLKKQNTFKLAGVAAAFSLLSACGDSSSGNENQIHKGTFTDSAVAGINYVCGEQVGVTDLEGKFTYQSGDACTFKLGDFSLGSISNMSAENPIITPFDVAKDDEQAIKIASLLQTIDADGNP